MLDFRDKKEVRTIGLLRERQESPGDMKLLGEKGMNNVKTPGRKKECSGRRIPSRALCFC